MNPGFPTLDDDALAATMAALAAAGLAPDWPTPSDRAALAGSTGWSGRHLDEAVRRAFAPYTLAACRRLVSLARRTASAARASPGNLDAPLPGNWGLLAILAGRVPAVASGALFQGLAARHTVVLKPSSAEPAFARLLCDLVARTAPFLAPAVTLLDAPPGDPRLVDAVAAAPAVLAYGSDATVAAVQAARPGRLTLVGGHRESIAILFGDALGSTASAKRLARAIARDASIYDQSGCLSPQVALVEDGAPVPARAFAHLLHEAFVETARTLPPGPIPILDAAAVRMFLEESRLLARASGGLVLPASGPVPPVVAFLPDLPARRAPGCRVLQVVPFRGDPDLASLLPTLASRLQGLAVAGDRRRLAAALDRFQAFRPCRVCAPGRLQSPPAGWPENGVSVVRALAAARPSD